MSLVLETGFIEQGISTDPEKIQKIAKCPGPRDVHGVRRVLGFFSYYIILRFSETAKPLVKLTEKDWPFQWNEDQDLK